jgi:MoaA/NifB/PqqE/SkfB family radical SAM enzyme
VAFGGGEPMGVPHFWDILERLVAAGTAIKLETNGAFIDDAAARRLHSLGVECIQISVDAATADTHELLRPGFSFAETLRAIDRLVALGRAPQWVFVPTRLNVHEMVQAFECACDHGCSAFVTGPLMRLGRAAGSWPLLACEPADYAREVAALRARAAQLGSDTALSIYPWDILTELQVRLTSPQAMLLVVPNGKVKLLNALPFAPADLRKVSLAAAWDAYRRAWQSPKVAAFIAKCGRDPSLLMHANETWDMPELATGESVAA